MKLSNKDQVGQALELLRKALCPYVEEKMQIIYGDGWTNKAVSHLKSFQKRKKDDSNVLREDVAALLTVINREWDKVFKGSLGPPDRALVQELIEVRNQWAHQSTFPADDAYRAIDSVLRLLRSIKAPQVPEVERQRQYVFRLLSQEQPRHDIHPIPVSPAEEARIRESLHDLLKRLPFQKAYLLKQALTHTSYKYENPNTGEDNEQLEFLGDALLTFLSGDFLYKRNPDLSAGEMTILRSNLVDASQLAKFAEKLDLGRWMRLGRGEDLHGGRAKSSLLSNVFEAVIGAYYMDSGIEAVRDLIDSFFEKAVDDLNVTRDSIPVIKDEVKGRLQTVVLGLGFSANPGRQPPKYKTIRSGGSDTDPQFTATVYVADSEYGRGHGRSKKEAEKRAAEDALVRMGLL